LPFPLQKEKSIACYRNWKLHYDNNTLFFSKAFCVISVESNFFKLQGVEHRKLCVENVLHLGFQIGTYTILAMPVRM